MFDQYPSSSLYMNYFLFSFLSLYSRAWSAFLGSVLDLGWREGGISAAAALCKCCAWLFFYMGGVLASGTDCGRGWDW